MKKVYFVQVGFEFDGSVYLPYAVGTIIAYCRSLSGINEEYEFSDIIFRREKLQSALDKIKEPFAVGFSCSVWNMEYNKALARLIKERYPQCFIVFGGHSAVEENLGEDYIDCVMFGEGEETFAQLLYGLSAGDISEVNNISYKEGGTVVRTDSVYSKSIENYPSAYLTGVFENGGKPIPVYGLLRKESRMLESHGTKFKRKLAVGNIPIGRHFGHNPAASAAFGAAVHAVRLIPHRMLFRRMPDHLRIRTDKDILAPAFQTLSLGSIQKFIINPTVVLKHLLHRFSLEIPPIFVGRL